MTTPIDLTNALIRYQDARPALRSAMHASALVVATQVAAERDALLTRLNGRWAWCDANPGHPAFVEREDAVMADLACYEATEDALAFAVHVLLGQVA